MISKYGRVFANCLQLAGISTCRSAWYYDYWGYLWNWYSEYYYAGCSAWRAVLAFSFIPIVLYLLSALLVSCLISGIFGPGGIADDY
jgi:uncharacterized membrane protein YtjA (UPF0391 family)